MLIVSINQSSVNIVKIVKGLNKFLPISEKLLVNIIVSSSHQIKVLNNRYRKKNKPTDVLSFRYQENFGEIFICLDQIKKNAKTHQLTTQQETRKIIIHGMLHLVGFDHQNNKQEKQMEKWQQKIENYVS